MPKTVPPLAEVKVRNAKPQEKDVKLFDGGGLFLLVTTTGSKLWHFKYRFDGKEKKLTFGAYPSTTLARAREKRDLAKGLIKDGIDPGALKKELAATRKAEELKASLTFETVAREWLLNQSATWAESHLHDNTCKLEKNVFPEIGSRSISEIGLTESLACLRKIEARGVGETAHRCKIILGQIFRYAASCGWRTDDPTALLKGALVPVKSKEYPAIIIPKEVGGMLRAIDCYSGPVVRYAIIFGSLVFLRSSEMRHGTWDEIDFETKQWNIPGSRMKLKQDHIVPLSRQALAILEELKPLTGSSRYIFPNGRTNSKPLSENGVNAGLASLGYKGRHCGHGWRATFRTIADEVLGMRLDLIEHQLAHAVKDPTGRSYNRTTFLDARREMMQTWADYLDKLRVALPL
jgi:integrase